MIFLYQYTKAIIILYKSCAGFHFDATWGSLLQRPNRYFPGPARAGTAVGGTPMNSARVLADTRAGGTGVSGAFFRLPRSPGSTAGHRRRPSVRPSLRLTSARRRAKTPVAPTGKRCPERRTRNAVTSSCGDEVAVGRAWWREHPSPRRYVPAVTGAFDTANGSVRSRAQHSVRPEKTSGFDDCSFSSQSDGQTTGVVLVESRFERCEACDSVCVSSFNENLSWPVGIPTVVHEFCTQ